MSKTCPFKRDQWLAAQKAKEEVLHGWGEQEVVLFGDSELEVKRLNECEEAKCALWDAERGLCSVFRAKEYQHTTESKDVLNLVQALTAMSGTDWSSCNGGELTRQIRDCLSLTLENYKKELKDQ